MKLIDLNTPFHKKSILTYGRDGVKAVRHYVEIQQIAGSLYKSKTETVGWGYEQCRLYLCFPCSPVGLDLGSLSFFGERTVEEMEQDSKQNGLDSPEHFIEMADAEAAAGGFIGNAMIEFVKCWAPEKAAEYAAVRQAYLDKLEQKRAEEQARRLLEQEEKQKVIQQGKNARRASLLGWGDALPELQLNRILAVLSKQYRYDGIVKTRLQHVIDCIAEGWIPKRRENVVSCYGSKWDVKESKPKTEYRLILPQGENTFSYTVTKTEFDFAVYLYNKKEKKIYENQESCKSETGAA